MIEVCMACGRPIALVNLNLFQQGWVHVSRFGHIKRWSSHRPIPREMLK